MNCKTRVEGQVKVGLTGPIEGRDLGRTLLRATHVEPKPDAEEGLALATQPRPPDRRLARILTWIIDCWSTHGLDEQAQLYDELGEHYPDFEEWLRSHRSSAVEDLERRLVWVVRFRVEPDVEDAEDSAAETREAAR